MESSKILTVKTITLGCKVNQFESEGTAAVLKELGWDTPPGNAPPCVCLINTCTVTAKAAMQSRQAIRQAIRSYPEARIVVTGCYAQIDADEIAKIPGVHAVVGHSHKHELRRIIPDLVDSAPDAAPLVLRENIGSGAPFCPIGEGVTGQRTRPFLKIQDGCNTFCTYCIVPHARGPSRSMSVDKALENIRKISETGVREVVLTGIHLGAYGLDLSPPASLLELVRQIDRMAHGMRIRLSSIEPTELCDRLIRQSAESPRICRHFHVPLQCGDDRILARMGRKYTTRVFADRVHAVHRMIPDAGIGADVLVGFPGEDQKAFENTCRLIESLPLTYLHVFPFSPRRGTPAYTMNEKVSETVIKSRCQALRKIGNLKKSIFYNKFIGKTLEVLIETRRDKTDGYLKGFSDNYIPVFIDGDEILKNRLVPVMIRSCDERRGVIGELP